MEKVKTEAERCAAMARVNAAAALAEAKEMLARQEERCAALDARRADTQRQHAAGLEAALMRQQEQHQAAVEMIVAAKRAEQEAALGAAQTLMAAEKAAESRAIQEAAVREHQVGEWDARPRVAHCAASHSLRGEHQVLDRPPGPGARSRER